jgi:hypothetical protein
MSSSPSATAPTRATRPIDDPRLVAWRAFLMAQAAVIRSLEADLA